MTATHDDLEPHITDPNALLEIFEQQRVGALQQVDYAREGMEQVKNTLNQLFKVPGQDEAAVDRAWKQLKPVRQVLKQMDAVLTGAYNVIEAVIEQRDEVAVELADITEAIDNEDTDHPQLKDLAKSIRQSGYEEGVSQGYESAYDDALDTAMSNVSDYDTDNDDGEFVEKIVRDTAEQWYIPRKMANDIISGISGDIQMTNDQREAFKAFLATF